jgi:hypothetical protein
MEVEFLHRKMRPRERRWWLTPIVLATEEAEIRRIRTTGVQSQPQAKSSWDPISKIPNTKKGLAEWFKCKQ